MDVIVSTLWNVTKVPSYSDHVPVRFALREKRVELGMPAPIPHWAPRQPAFKHFFEQIVTEVGLRAHPMEKLSDVKDCMREAWERMKRIAEEKGAEAINEQIFWALTAVRGVRSGDRMKTRKAMRAYRKLQEFFDDDGEPYDVNGLLDLVCKLTAEDIGEQLNELEAFNDEPMHCKAMRASGLST